MLRKIKEMFGVNEKSSRINLDKKCDMVDEAQ